MPSRDNQPLLGPMDNWRSVLREAREYALPVKAPGVAIVATEVWREFMLRRKDREAATERPRP